MKKNLLYTFCILFITATNVTAQYCSDTLFTGNGTMHDFTGSNGACSLGIYDTSTYVFAIDDSQFDGSFNCGACAQITSSAASIVARVVDQCGGCGANGLDLSLNAYRKLDSTMLGVVPIQWKFVGCPLSTPVAFIYQGSNPYYIKVQVRNHRYPISKVFVKGNVSTYIELSRTVDNFFSATWLTGPENGPYDYIVVNVMGDTITETGIPLGNNTTVYPGTKQFPVCAGEVTAIAPINKNQPVVSVYSSSANVLSIINQNSYAIEYQVVDMLGRSTTTGKLTSNGKENIRVEQSGVYVVNYTAQQFGREAKRVLVH